MVIDATMAAFPNQNVALSIGSVAGDLDPAPAYLSRTVVDYATTTHGRFITEKNSLAATTVDPPFDTSLGNWQVLFDQFPHVAAQMLWVVSGDTDYQMNRGIPGNEQTILLNAITIGAHYGTQYQEIYKPDLEDPAMSSVIDTANALLTATPPLPRAPSNLSGTSSGPFITDLTWHDNANVELGYRIESKIGAAGTYVVQTTAGPNTTGIRYVRPGMNRKDMSRLPGDEGMMASNIRRGRFQTGRRDEIGGGPSESQFAICSAAASISALACLVLRGNPTASGSIW
jgi:hypothetical protein